MRKVGNEELSIAVLEALEDVKPPSRLREMIMWLMLGFAGGIGLGVFILWSNSVMVK